MSQNVLPVVEMFYSIQGEGTRILPALFLRTGLCNFKCEGFGCKVEKDNEIIKGCDSIRAVSPKFAKEWTHYISYEDLVNDIDNIMPSYSKHNILKPDIILTGGEPTIHWDNPILQRTLSHYASRGHKITVETNASIPITFARKYQETFMFSMSVKLSNSGEPDHKRINIDNITNIVEHSPSSYLKFVVSKKTWEQDWLEIKKILKELPVFVKVLLMPMGETKKDIDENCNFVMNKCAELGFGYSDRLHIRADMM